MPNLRRHNRPQVHGRRLSGVADSIDAQRAALPLRRSPARHVPHADGKGRARQSQEERSDQQPLVCSLLRRNPDRDRYRGHQQAEDRTAAEPVRENAHGDARQRSQNDGNRSQQSRFERCEMKGLLKSGSEGADEPPCRETDRE